MTDPEQQPHEAPMPSEAKSAEMENESPVAEEQLMTTEPVPPFFAQRSFPEWSIWDVLAVVGFTAAAILLFSMIALALAHVATGGRHVAMDELATSPAVVIGSQFAAYPVVIVFMIALVRNKSRERFWQAIRWNWPGAATLGFFLAGIFLAFLVEFASRWLPIPKSLPVDKFFSDATGAYLMAVFGVRLAPLLEETVLPRNVVSAATGVGNGAGNRVTAHSPPSWNTTGLRHRS
jgi:hypothetical protein